MTKKRFKVNADFLNNIESIIDNETGIEHDYLEIEELLNGLADENEQLKQFKEQVFFLIDKRIRTLEANSKQCHFGGSHEKGIEFTLQAELLERLKKELSE